MAQKKFKKSLLKTGYLIAYQTRNNSWFSRQIVNTQLKMGYSVYFSSFTHIEIILNHGKTLDATFPKLKVVDPTQEHKGRYAVILGFQATDYKIQRYNVAINGLSLSYDNQGYDFFGILKFKLGWLFHHIDRYFCSEICAEAINQEYPETFEDTFRIPPAGLVSCPLFKEKWSGII